MSRECTICGRKTISGNNVSHSHLKTRRTWKVNLQRIKTVINGTPKRTWICTSCIKSNKVKKA